MCEHWRESREELSLEEWGTVFKDISDFGVKTVVFSGGEPLMRQDLADLLRSAYQNGLRIGLMTNGTMINRSSGDRRRMIKAIAECVGWVAISVDGTEIEDTKIRNPRVRDRINGLKEFCAGITKRNPTLKLSATVTLQRDNIHMSLYEACRFIHEDLAIPQVNFKLATGAREALERQPQYLLQETELEQLVRFLWNNPLPQERGNNLDYLGRCFAGGIFNIKDSGEGVPVRSFYLLNNLRCYTPFVFSLIDCDGGVYPCCHLYRDNHGFDPQSRHYRARHTMGNVRETKFELIWNGERYAEERKLLEKVNPTGNVDFIPCGECTRYCQHNLALTRIHKAYEHNLRELEKAIENTNPEDRPVWV
jgi:MoaA/NifB/PqqE/SkfB family radical SAM enzyme